MTKLLLDKSEIIDIMKKYHGKNILETEMKEGKPSSKIFDRGDYSL
jgi:hypothetical protein